MSAHAYSTPEDVLSDYLASLPYDFPDNANLQMDAAGAIYALHKAGYHLYRPTPFDSPDSGAVRR